MVSAFLWGVFVGVVGLLAEFVREVRNPAYRRGLLHMFARNYPDDYRAALDEPREPLPSCPALRFGACRICDRHWPLDGANLEKHPYINDLDEDAGVCLGSGKAPKPE